MANKMWCVLFHTFPYLGKIALQPLTMLKRKDCVGKTTVSNLCDKVDANKHFKSVKCITAISLLSWLEV